MKLLNVASTKIMNKLVGMVVDGYVKVDNTEGAFMSVSVEVIFEDVNIKLISLAHYFLQCGDLMADPEMCFLFSKMQGAYFPYYYKQDTMGLEEESAEIRDGEILGVNITMQKEHTQFANMWLRNIKYQQSL